ncbi:hypothetical protein Tco_0809686 [Tanacetum coccineum]
MHSVSNIHALKYGFLAQAKFKRVDPGNSGTPSPEKWKKRDEKSECILDSSMVDPGNSGTPSPEKWKRRDEKSKCILDSSKVGFEIGKSIIR